MNSSEFEVYLSIQKELERARTKFPQSTHTFTALVEEVGELGKALITQNNKRKHYVKEEAIQVAVMAIRLILDGDESHQLGGA